MSYDFAEITRITRRIISAANNGRLIQDVLACPDYDHESVDWAGIARWDPARQRLALVEVLELSGANCRGCGRRDLSEEPLFLTSARISAAARAAYLPALICLHPAGWFCDRCGSDDLVQCVAVRRDPLLDRYELREPLEDAVTCLACGWLAPPAIEKLTGVARVDQARAARAARAADEKAVAVIDRLAAYVGR